MSPGREKGRRKRGKKKEEREGKVENRELFAWVLCMFTAQRSKGELDRKGGRNLRWKWRK